MNVTWTKKLEKQIDVILLIKSIRYIKFLLKKKVVDKSKKITVNER